MIESSIYREALEEGRLAAERELCAAMAQKHHAAVFSRALPIIEACEDPERLKTWALAASDLSDSDFLKLLGV